MNRLTLRAGEHVELATGESERPIRHLFEQPELDAVNVALAARRPLLVRGEPGIGKSQLARAVAKALDRSFRSIVLNARTESEDLLWQLDAVSRLAEAQVAYAVDEGEGVAERLLERNFVRPGILWWAFDGQSARQQEERFLRRVSVAGRDFESASKDSSNAVVLLDEIDKADVSVPNGLLEALGHQEFRVPWLAEPIRMQPGDPPLVIITTNEERSLPDAFLRRCIVLHMKWQDAHAEDWLVERGLAHVGDRASEEVLREAARQLVDDRAKAKSIRGLSLPGQAEYLDLVRALVVLHDDESDQLRALKTLSRYTFRKHPELES